jgi:hypothetical protein
MRQISYGVLLGEVLLGRSIAATESWTAGDPITRTAQTPAVSAPLTGCGAPSTGRPAPRYGGAGEPDPDSPRLRRAVAGDPAPPAPGRPRLGIGAGR